MSEIAQAILCAAIECLPFEFFAIGKDGRYILQNAAVREDYGDAIGKRPEDCAPDEATRQLWLDNNRRAFGGERVEGEVETHVGGETRHFYNIITPIRDNSEVYGILGINVDITERKRAEEQLQLQSLVLNQTQDTVTVTDLQGVITYVNDAQCATVKCSRESLIGQSVTTYGDNPGRGATQREIIHKTLADGEWRGEVVNRTSDGVEIIIDCRTRLVKDADGRPIAMCGVGTDITARKQAEEKLRESEERFKLFMDNSPAIAWMKDEQGRYVYINESCGRRTGHRLEDRLGKTDFELWPLATAELFWKNDQKVLSGGQVVEVVEESTKPDGNLSYCRNFKFPFQDSTGRRFVGGVGIDITERKQAEEALQKAHDELEQRVQERTAELSKANECFRQSNDELQAIYDGMIEGLLITDIETKRFVRVNPSMCRMLGYSEEELLAASVKDIHPPEEVPSDLQRFQAAAEGRVSINEDRPVLRKDGSVFYADITGHRIFYDERPCLLGLFRDITERKQAEEALERERRTLKHLLHASDHERQLIAYEIHDGLAQELAAAIMQFDAFDHLKETKPKQAADAYHAAITMLRQGHFEARRLIAGVRPPILDESGVVEAIAHLVNELRREKRPRIEFLQPCRV